MTRDSWVIKWKDELSETYLYGSEIEFLADGSVSFFNPLMPPGTVIHRWYSKTNFQFKRIEPSLPLIDGEGAYLLTLNIEEKDSSKSSTIVRICIFDRYDNPEETIVIREKKFYFKPTIKAYSYYVELINGGNPNFVFKSLKIEEVSEKEFDAEQKRIEEIKEASYKSEKKWRKSKKSDRRRTKKSNRDIDGKI